MGIQIQFNKIYRRLDSLINEPFYATIRTREPTIEILDTNPESGTYVPKIVYIYASNKPTIPTSINEMTLSDIIDTNGINGTFSSINSILASSSYIAFVKNNIGDQLELFAIEHFISENDNYNI